MMIISVCQCVSYDVIVYDVIVYDVIEVCSKTEEWEAIPLFSTVAMDTGET